ncbi:MAG: restriction endonuclease [Bacillota bacterium]|nr:restriction endonuclease [Bacillota bacterium]
MLVYSIQQQKYEWRKKDWVIPDLKGGKQNWFNLVKSLVLIIGDSQINDMNAVPEIPDYPNPQSWRSYIAFLKRMGLVINQSGSIRLSSDGHSFKDDPTKIRLANQIQSKCRLFGEVLNIIQIEPLTIEDIDRKICSDYNLDWANLSNTRRRTDWLEVLDLIHAIGNRKWEITDAGTQALQEWCIVTPQAAQSTDESDESIAIPEPPLVIAENLQRLEDSPELHRKRNTYNLWVPSPNRINNLRTILQFASERTERSELFAFIENEFGLKVSSVESMLLFLKASGLLEEVGRNIYIATPETKAWLESGSDLDFIRILHCNMRFVGETIQTAMEDITRNEIYSQAKLYGLNSEKSRWITGFLIEAGLLEEPSYLHIKATLLGKAFVATLQLASYESIEAPAQQEKEEKITTEPEIEIPNEIINRLLESSKNPMAENKQSGVAFEENIASIFRIMGFDARRIGGSGDTDVVVRWQDEEGKKHIAIIDAKSKSGGQVSHSDISDVAIDTHKEKNNAEYIAIIGPGFAGDTIKNYAKKKGFALITATELCEIARASQVLALNLQEIALFFQVPNGLSQLSEIISEKQRELDIISLVVEQFRKEQEELGSLSPRDLFLLLRGSNVSPSLDELVAVFKTLSQPEIGIIKTANKTVLSENTLCHMRNGKRTTNRLRALASAIDKGFSD